MASFVFDGSMVGTTTNKLDETQQWVTNTYDVIILHHFTSFFWFFSALTSKKSKVIANIFLSYCITFWLQILGQKNFSGEIVSQNGDLLNILLTQCTYLQQNFWHRIKANSGVRRIFLGGPPPKNKKEKLCVGSSKVIRGHLPSSQEINILKCRTVVKSRLLSRHGLKPGWPDWKIFRHLANCLMWT
jgi:hypothetical protein